MVANGSLSHEMREDVVGYSYVKQYLPLLICECLTLTDFDFQHQLADQHVAETMKRNVSSSSSYHR